MKYILYPFLFSLFLFIVPKLAFCIDIKNKNEIIIKGIEIARHSKFSQSLDYFKNLLDENKSNNKDYISYYFYYFAVFSFFLSDIEDYSYEQKYEDFFKNSSKLFEKKINKLKELKKSVKKNNKDHKKIVVEIEKKIAKTSFYYGGILGFKGLYEVDFNNWWGAFFLGNNAVKFLKKSIEFNPSFYEPYYGLGIYYYWKGAKAKDLWYVPFIEDSRQKGIDALKISLEKSDLVRVESQISLIRIGINEMNDEMIEKYSKGFFDKYPNNVYLHRNLIMYYAKKKKYQKMKVYLDNLSVLKKNYLQYDLTYFSMFLNYHYSLYYFNVKKDYNKSYRYLEKNFEKKEVSSKKEKIILKKYLKISKVLKKNILKKIKKKINISN